MPAKMRPTSPRGIIPSPTVRPEMPRGVTRPHAHLPIIAATVMSRAKPMTPGFTKFSTCTSMPMRTKKTGTRSAVSACRLSWSGRSPRFRWSSKWTSSMHEAGGEGAHDRGEPGRRREPGEAEAEAERERLHDAGRAQGQRVAEEPRRRVASRRGSPRRGSRAPCRTMRRMPEAARVVPSPAARMTPAMMASTTRPRTSSITAAPEDDPRARRPDGLRLLQDARGDPHRGGGQHRSEERVRHPGLAGEHQLGRRRSRAPSAPRPPRGRPRSRGPPPPSCPSGSTRGPPRRGAGSPRARPGSRRSRSPRARPCWARRRGRGCRGGRRRAAPRGRRAGPPARRARRRAWRPRGRRRGRAGCGPAPRAPTRRPGRAAVIIGHAVYQRATRPPPGGAAYDEAASVRMRAALFEPAPGPKSARRHPRRTARPEVTMSDFHQFGPVTALPLLVARDTGEMERRIESLSRALPGLARDPARARPRWTGPRSPGSSTSSCQVRYLDSLVLSLNHASLRRLPPRARVLRALSRAARWSLWNESPAVEALRRGDGRGGALHRRARARAAPAGWPSATSSPRSAPPTSPSRTPTS